MPQGLHAKLHTLPLHFGRRIQGSEGGSSNPPVDIPRYLRMWQAGRFDVAGFVSHRCGIADINDAISTMRSGASVHTMVHFSSIAG
jgi:Zn-dependent alcohol dehydrogenase